MGYLAIALAAVLWAAGGTTARALIDAGASAVELTEARAWITVVGVGAYLTLRRRSDPGRDRDARPPVWLVVAFGLSIAMANVTYYLALSRLPVAVAIVVQYTAPGLVVLWAAMVQQRGPTRRVVVALGLAFAGVVLLSELRTAVTGNGVSPDAPGFLFAAASAVAFSAYMLTGERVGRAFGSARSVFLGFCVASAFWIAVQLVRGRPATLMDAEFWPGIAFLGIATTLAPFLLFVYGLRRVEASRAAIVSTLEPLTAAVLAYVFLAQRLGVEQSVGAAMVVVGIGIVQSERPPPPEVLEERAVLE